MDPRDKLSGVYIPSKNARIHALTLSHRARHINLSDLPIEIVDGHKVCVWCLTPLKGKAYKWCSAKCTNYALAWSRPQKEQNLIVLMVKQDYRCAHCQYDYNPLADSLVLKSRKNYKIKSKLEINFYLGKILRSKSPEEHKPEVDHIVRVKDGGQVLGHENHQILCRQCHKVKSRQQNSGPRKKSFDKT